MLQALRHCATAGGQEQCYLCEWTLWAHEVCCPT